MLFYTALKMSFIYAHILKGIVMIFLLHMVPKGSWVIKFIQIECATSSRMQDSNMKYSEMENVLRELRLLKNSCQCQSWGTTLCG